jgi:hypothetical protein
MQQPADIISVAAQISEENNNLIFTSKMLEQRKLTLLQGKCSKTRPMS